MINHMFDIITAFPLQIATISGSFPFPQARLQQGLLLQHARAARGPSRVDVNDFSIWLFNIAMENHHF